MLAGSLFAIVLAFELEFEFEFSVKLNQLSSVFDATFHMSNISTIFESIPFSLRRACVCVRVRAFLFGFSLNHVYNCAWLHTRQKSQY